MEVPAVADVEMRGDRLVRAGQVRGGLGGELLGPLELAALGRPDRRGRALDRRARRAQRHLTGAVLLLEDGAHAGARRARSPRPGPRARYGYEETLLRRSTSAGADGGAGR